MRTRLALVVIVLAAGALLGGASADTTTTATVENGTVETVAIDNGTVENETIDNETTESETTTTAPKTTATPTVDPGSELAGSGTAEDPYVIERADQFALIDGDLEADYVLGSDLDFSDEEIDPVAEYFDFDEPSRQFNGTLDGQGHTIASVTVNGTSTPLIRTVGETGRVESIDVVDIEGEGTAAVVGANRGTVTDVHVSGTFRPTGEFASAPLVEFNTGTVRSVSGGVTVESDPDESVDGPTTGGLVGHSTHEVALGGDEIDAATTGTTNASVAVEDVLAENGQSYDTDTTTDTLAVTDVDRQTVAVDVAPDRMSVNRTTEAAVRLDEVPAGLSGYELRLGVVNDSVASIESVAAPEEFGGIRSVERTEDGALVEVSDSADAVSGSASNVTLATLTLRSDAPGETGVTATVETVMAEDGTPYPTRTERGRVEVVNVTAEPIDGTKPQDIDDDWTYEDVNGNGRLDFPDVNTFFQYSDEPVVTDHVAAYDFDGDGDIDLQDVLALFEMV
ncbi:MAG: hypothetical protein ACOCYZ_03215 [Halococcoides sp.]